MFAILYKSFFSIIIRCLFWVKSVSNKQSKTEDTQLLFGSKY
jgi:hypothetical protein